MGPGRRPVNGTRFRFSAPAWQETGPARPPGRRDGSGPADHRGERPPLAGAGGGERREKPVEPRRHAGEGVDASSVGAQDVIAAGWRLRVVSTWSTMP